MDLRPGAQVIDVACGTGHAALEAARLLCDVTGIDYVPKLVDVARRRAEAEGLAADFQVGDAEALPFGDDSFDFVLSAIGVMFTADHDRAAAELVRVCRSGGRIGMANWTPTGFVGQMLKTVGKHVPPLRADLLRLAHENNRALDGTFVSDWNHLVVTAEKR